MRVNDIDESRIITRLRWIVLRSGSQEATVVWSSLKFGNTCSCGATATLGCSYDNGWSDMTMRCVVTLLVLAVSTCGWRGHRTCCSF